MTKLLSQLLPSFEHKIVSVDGAVIDDVSEIQNIPISSLVFDSREVTEGSIYFALPGTHTDGNLFIPDAIMKGSNAVIFQGELSDELKEKISRAIVSRTIEIELSAAKQKFAPCLIKVSDSRFSMAPVSDCFFDSPSKRLIVIGVTGTEGKSSTVSFIWQLLKLLGQKAGFISTVEYSFGGEALPNPEHQTTPEAPIIQHHLNEMLDNGCKFAVIESSSHGLSTKLNRLGNIIFDCAVFMNVKLEHLEFHKTFEQYRNDKANLFRALDKHSHVKTIGGLETKINAIGIVNADDDSAKYFSDSTKFPVFGISADIQNDKKTETNMPVMKAENIMSDGTSLSFDINLCGFENKFIRTESQSIKINSKTPGAFNAYNLMASMIAVSSVTGISLDEIAKKVPEILPVKGRMTSINMGQDFEVIVDYAHTPSSFEMIFPPIRKRCEGKMICVFGSGGERDLTKRPIQGEIAAKFCDVVILADEDPRGEDPVSLLNDIGVGVKKVGKIEGENLFVIPDRKKAIRYAFSLAKKNDIVLLLGKSHENSIIYKDYKIPYDEISEAKKALSEI